MEITPLPGIAPEILQAHMNLHALKAYRCKNPDCFACVRYQTAGSTAHRIKVEAEPGRVTCPTCGMSVWLATWWSHGCKIAAPEYNSVPGPRAAPVKRREWPGDIPAACNYCNAPIRNGFADTPFPGRSSWGIMCGLCWNLHGRAPGAYYEKRRGKFIKVTK